MKSAPAVSCSTCSYCDAVDLGGTRYLVPRLGTRRLVLGTAAAATCSTAAAFLELESVILTAERPEDCGAREITSTDCRRLSESLLDYVIRQFHLIFGTAE